jgi:hypothetical protein
VPTDEEDAMAATFQVTFDAANPGQLGRFWAAVLGYVEQPPPEGHASWQAFLDSVGVPPEERDTMYAVVDPDGSRPRLLFQKVPEGKTAKNRVHLDVNCGGGRDVPLEERTARVESESERLVGLGARRLGPGEEPGGYWVVMADPEGNEFCLQ